VRIAVDGSIDRLHCRYNLRVPRDTAPALARRLDTLAQEHVAAHYAAALDRALGADPTVYVLRRVAARTTLHLNGATSDARIAAAWSDDLVAATLRVLAENHPDEVARFPDQAAYVAGFIGALLAGDAWTHWHYQPFAALYTGSTAATLRALLRAGSADLTAILASLQAAGHLERTLAALEPADCARIWNTELGATASLAPAAVQPLFSYALRLLAQLGAVQLAADDAAALFAAYLATGPLPPDWRDRRGLAVALYAIVRYLTQQRPTLRPAPGAGVYLAPALAALDWLDRDWLQERLLALFIAPASPPAAGADAIIAWLDALDRWACDPQAGRAQARAMLAASAAGAAPPPAILSTLVRFLIAQGYLRPFAAGEAAALRSRLAWAYLPVAAQEPIAQHELLTALCSAPPHSPYAPLEDIVAAVHTLLTRLGLQARPQIDTMAALRAYLAFNAPAGADRTIMALAALRYLAALGYLRPNAEAGAPIADAVITATAGRAGFDHAQLHTGIAGLLSTLQASAAHDPGAGDPLPRRRRLLADITAALQRGVTLDRHAPAGAANALRLYSALIAHTPAWAGDPLAGGTIQRLLEAWALWEAARSTSPAADQPAPQPPIDPTLLAELGEAARTIIRALAAAADHARSRRADQADDDIPEPPNQAVLPGSAGTHGPALAIPDGATFATHCAGLFLLLRALHDARLPALVAQANYPHAAAIPPLAALIAGLAIRWAGPAAVDDAVLDPGVTLFAGLDTAPSLADVHAALAGLNPDDHARFQHTLCSLLAGRRLLRSPILDIYRLPYAETTALIGGDSQASLWPFGHILAGAAPAAPLIAQWRTAWSTCLGAVAASAAADATATLKLQRSLESLATGRMGMGDADLTLDLTALALLRIWAAWLGGMAGASAPYLLEQFIRRPGTISVRADAISVELAPRPLDVVLQLAGYLADIEQTAWLQRRRVSFRIGQASA
jgi:hypothetical protein